MTFAAIVSIVQLGVLGSWSRSLRRARCSKASLLDALSNATLMLGMAILLLSFLLFPPVAALLVTTAGTLVLTGSGVALLTGAALGTTLVWHHVVPAVGDLGPDASHGPVEVEVRTAERFDVPALPGPIDELLAGFAGALQAPHGPLLLQTETYFGLAPGAPRGAAAVGRILGEVAHPGQVALGEPSRVDGGLLPLGLGGLRRLSGPGPGPVARRP